MQLPSTRERVHIRSMRERHSVLHTRERPSIPSPTRERSALTTEMRHSAMLLGGAIGLMGTFALLLFFGTSWLAG